jgi:hypothetical protein
LAAEAGEEGVGRKRLGLAGDERGELAGKEALDQGKRGHWPGRERPADFGREALAWVAKESLSVRSAKAGQADWSGREGLRA